MNIAKGWSTWKDGMPYDGTLHSTKRSILISYDLWPLRGLPQTERFLRSKGITIHRTKVEVCDRTERQGYAAMVNGRIDPYSLEWSICHTGGGVWKVKDRRGVKSLCWWSLLFYANCENIKTITEPERRILGQCYCIDRNYSDPLSPRDGRQKSRLTSLIAESERIMKAHNVKLVPIRFLL